MLTPVSGTGQALSDTIVSALEPFSTLFRHSTWMKVQLLLVGAILSPRKRTVTSALRAVGLSDEAGFAKYHHVLSRAVWSPLQLSRVLLLLLLLIRHLAMEDEPLVFGIDETLERRWGSRISAKGIFRDAVRSAGTHMVMASGLRWVSLMWLTHIPWANRTWALPVLTTLAPSESYHQRMGRPHKKITDWGATDDLPVAPLAAGSAHRHRDRYGIRSARTAALLSVPVRGAVIFISRLRLDAALFAGLYAIQAA